MAEKTFPLERFYYGKLQDTAPTVKPTVLARTSGITAEHVKECLLAARLAPPTLDQTSDKMPASIGIFRGEKLDFIMSVAQVNDAGVPQLLFVLLPKGPMSWLAGNLQPFRSLGNLEMPMFSAPRDNLTPFVLKDPKMATNAQQGKVMSNFLFYCKDKMETAEGVLTGLINGKPLAIINAPNSLDKRLNFIEGVSNLLPPPVRMNLTFATNVLSADSTLAQIKFLVNSEAPKDHVVYDWEAGTLAPAEYNRHDYAKFILAQLRLDPDRVIEYTENLSKTTAWRAMRKDTLQDALAWAAQRARVDATVKTGQPADRDKVANILRQDPTLSNDLRVAYAKHLLAMTLALKEWEPADIIPGIAAAHRDVAEAIFGQLRDGINNKKHQAESLKLVEHWMLNVPEAPALPWHQLWHLASWIELQKYLEDKDYHSASEYIHGLSAKGEHFKIDTVASQIILQTLKYAYESPQLAQALLILAATHVPSGGFQQLVTDERLAKQFAPPMQKALAVLRQDAHGTGAGKPEPEVLIRGVASLPKQYRPSVLAQLVEIALYLRRSELIDATVLQEILRLAQSEHADRYKQLINYILEDFADFEKVKSLGPSGWAVLPQIYFMGGYVEEGIYLIELYQGNLFNANTKLEYINLVGDVFLKSLLPAKAMNGALEGFEKSRIWPEARIRAYTGALINQQWHASMENAARRLTTMIFNNGDLTRAVSVEHILRLLQFHGERTNALDMLRVASAIIDKALMMGKDGPPFLVQAWAHLAWQPEVGHAALELLRRYIRSVPPEAAKGLPQYFSGHLGKNVGEALEASHLVRSAIGEDNLQTFAENIQIALKLLTDLAIPYHKSKSNPDMGRLRHDLDTMSGGLAEQERALLADYINQIAQLILEIGDQTGNRKRPSGEWTREKVLETLPENAVEFMLWMGCRFAKEPKLPALDLGRSALAHIFGNRSVNMLFDEVNITFRVLSNLKRAFQDGTPNFSLDALNAEIDSLWDAISLYNQRQIDNVLAYQSWEMGQLLPYLSARSSEKILQDKGTGKKLESGKQAPTNELEALRWISGYFSRKHKR